MKTAKKQIRKGAAVLLAVVLLAGMLHPVSWGKITVQAANNAGTGNVPEVTAFATKAELMTKFTPDAEGESTTIGKVVFGKDSSGNPLKWYILGQDSGVEGENIAIFTADPIAINLPFEDDYLKNKTFQAAFGTYPDTAKITEVYPNHYGASDLRKTLQGLSTNTSYFTTAEQSFMQATTVTTKDTKNQVDYTTTDVLYAGDGKAYANDTESAYYFQIGSGNQIVLSKKTYWNVKNNSTGIFWLRTPAPPEKDDDNEDRVSIARSGGFTVDDYVDKAEMGSSGPITARPASNLKLSSVSFASAATAASSATIASGTIEKGMAMTLRLDGNTSTGTIPVGEALYDAQRGILFAKKAASAGTVALVVQGNDGTKDWYYSKTINGAEWISAADIKNALTLTDISLSDCRIWLETTGPAGASLPYAVMAKAGTFIDAVAITGVDTPIGGTGFDKVAASGTAGLAAGGITIAWTKGKEPAGENADYDTTYTANITLTPAEGRAFSSVVSATVNENAAAVISNADGTITVTQDFKTEKRKLVSVAAPAVPKNNRFTNRYTAENVLASKELGATAQVTLEGKKEPAVVDMAVEWSLVNGNKYDTAALGTNTFQWKVKEAAYAGYDINNVILEGTIELQNACTAHVDKNADGKCDLCKEAIASNNGKGSGANTTAGETIPKTHTHEGGTATCKDKAICTVCGKSYGELSTTHAWDAGVVTKEATATGKGEKTYTCSVCKTTKTGEIPALGVPKKETAITDESSKAIYKITKSALKKGTVTYVAPVDEEAGEVIVPDTITIHGVKFRVTAIEKNVFRGNKNIKSVTIGKNVKTIGANAFRDCSKLKVIIIKSTKQTIQKIGSKAFAKTPQKLTVKLPKKKFNSYKAILIKRGISKNAVFKKI